MPVRQMHLFDPPKPLVQRLGDAFIRAAPRELGVYIMISAHFRGPGESGIWRSLASLMLLTRS